MRIQSRLVLLSLGTLIPVLAFCPFMLIAFNRGVRFVRDALDAGSKRSGRSKEFLHA